MTKTKIRGVFPLPVAKVGILFYKTDDEINWYVSGVNPLSWSILRDNNDYTSNLPSGTGTPGANLVSWTFAIDTVKDFTVSSDGTAKTLSFTGVTPGYAGTIVVSKLDTSAITLGAGVTMSSASLANLQIEGNYIISYICFATGVHCSVSNNLL
jgi:hypothetical protein